MANTDADLKYLTNGMILYFLPAKNEHVLWSTQIEDLVWGMDRERAEQFYPFADNGREVSRHIFYYVLKEPQKIYGCEMSVTLVFEEGYGLTGVIGNTDDVSRLQENIEE